MRIIDELSLNQSPASAFVLSADKTPVSEYITSPDSEIVASFVCASVACDNHNQGLLPGNIPEAPIGTVYTKRWIEIREGVARQLYYHFSREEFIRYFREEAKELSVLKEGPILLLGGFSWQGIVLAELFTRHSDGQADHLLVTDLYTPTETEPLAAYLTRTGLKIRSVSSEAGSGRSRESLLAAVRNALDSVRAEYPSILNPVSQTLAMADRLALAAGYPIASLDNTTRVLGNLTMKEIEIYGRLVSDQKVAEALSQIKERLGNNIDAGTHDVFLMVAQAVEYHAPGFSEGFK